MSLNWAMLTPNNTPVPLPQEEIVTSIETGAEVTVFLPDEPPAAGRSGASVSSKKLKESGGIWLTNQRVVFAARRVPATSNPNTKNQPSFTSLSVPLLSILASRFEQPTLGANYLTLEVSPVPDGGLSGVTRVEVRFKDHPVFQFVSTLEKVRERSRYMRRSLEEDGPPMYTDPAAESSTSTFVMAGPSVQPPAYDA